MPSSQYRAHHISARYSRPGARNRDYENYYNHQSRPSKESYSHRDQRQYENRGYIPDRRPPRDNRPPSFRPDTYGTYIWPLKTQGVFYDTMDPTTCGCTCCPHPHIVSSSQKDRAHDQYTSATQSQSRKRDSGRREELTGRSSSPPSRSHPRSRSRSHSPPQPQSQSNSHNERASPRDTGEFIIDVVDSSNGTLRHQHGTKYPLALSTTASVASVLSFLAPKKRRAKVIVHWKDGDTEILDDLVSMKEVRRSAKYLQVKDKKRVHWA
ncbi:hypothetical protein B0T10DRAFT_52595 [Thelonectria olida]|uniref:Uncharacterized protein n=1 Tax=Thelonectria olida TaxID=1576542 RepID=A0A9P8W4M8_9HYPO|nr:hypothetical protein B0T10DRAFT_52595 [Thelonectria olida]